jgi:hypothetical protein
MDDNVALALLASCRTRHIRAKWFRRVPRLCICLHKLQYANGRLLLQAPLLFPPVSGVLPYCAAHRQKAVRETMTRLGLREITFDFDFAGARVLAIHEPEIYVEHQIR